MEYWNVGVLGFKRINPPFHPPLFHSLLRWSEAIEQRNEAYESFSAPASVKFRSALAKCHWGILV
jgi:hypothetical protein